MIKKKKMLKKIIIQEEEKQFNKKLAKTAPAKNETGFPEKDRLSRCQVFSSRSIARNSASVRTGIPSVCAFVSLEPAAAPATT